MKTNSEKLLEFRANLVKMLGREDDNSIRLEITKDKVLVIESKPGSMCCRATKDETIWTL